MLLNNKDLIEKKEEYIASNIELSSYDRNIIKENTKKAPKWLHLGAGNIFRAFPANLMQNLIDKKLENTGIIVGEGFDYEIIDKVYNPHDDLTLLVTLNGDGSIRKKVIDSVVYAYKCDPSYENEWKEFEDIFANPSLQMVSFTITEKGYSLVDAKGSYLNYIKSDLENGPDKVIGLISKVVKLLYERYKSNKYPLALVSMDNCSHNGEKLQNAITTIAKQWVKNGKCEHGFLDYIAKKVSFPWSMIDKITPRPDTSVEKMLNESGFKDTELVITSKNTYIAPFVNAEKAQYLVIEDDFPNGRPKLEESGVYFTTRDVVNKVEKMKVCTCLNPLHTCLAIYGCILGFNLISEEMKDPQLKKFVEIIGYKEGLPVVVDPKIINPKDFIKEVIEDRIPNPFMPDTPQRIACDTSQKLPIRYGETIKAYIESENLDVAELKLIPLVFAGWLRYLMAIDDNNKAFELSPDPLLDYATKFVENIKLGKDFNKEDLRPLLEDEKIFGVNLYDVGMANIVLSYFKSMIAGPNAVRKTLIEIVN